MNPNDWVMTNTDVGQLWMYGGMYSRIIVFDNEGKKHPLIVPTDELKVISKEVADIMRSV